MLRHRRTSQLYSSSPPLPPPPSSSSSAAILRAVIRLITHLHPHQRLVENCDAVFIIINCRDLWVSSLSALLYFVVLVRFVLCYDLLVCYVICALFCFAMRFMLEIFFIIAVNRLEMELEFVFVYECFRIWNPGPCRSWILLLTTIAPLKLRYLTFHL